MGLPLRRSALSVFAQKTERVGQQGANLTHLGQKEDDLNGPPNLQVVGLYSIASPEREPALEWS